MGDGRPKFSLSIESSSLASPLGHVSSIYFFADSRRCRYDDDARRSPVAACRNGRHRTLLMISARSFIARDSFLLFRLRQSPRASRLLAHILVDFDFVRDSASRRASRRRLVAVSKHRLALQSRPISRPPISARPPDIDDDQAYAAARRAEAMLGDMRHFQATAARRVSQVQSRRLANTHYEI